MSRPFIVQAAAFAVCTLALFGSRITAVLHAESSALIAAAGFMTVGLVAISSFRSGRGVALVTFEALAAALVPLALLTAGLLVVDNCAYGEGLLIYMLFVPPSLILAVSLAYLLVAGSVRQARTVFIVTSLVLAAIPSLFTIKFFPQFYVYNHVFGGVLGPVYDEDLVIRSGFVVYRLLTVLWTLLLFLIGRGLAEKRSTSFVVPALVVVVISIVYVFGGSLGIRGSTAQLAASLGSVHETEHFVIHYDESDLDSSDLDVLEVYHEYHYQRLAGLLDERVEPKIRVFLYPDPSTKARLTGAGTTSIAPVWLRRPQMHLLSAAVGSSLSHELVHVFSREFAPRFTHAPTRVGLVEGLAVAFESPDGLPDIDQQVRIILDNSFRDTSITDVSVLEDYDNSRLARLVGSPFFWLDRGAVAYTASGSFVRWLIRNHQIDFFKLVYSGSNFADAYGVTLVDLVAQWREYIVSLPVDRDALSVAGSRFSVPSLFEKRCPHYVPPELRSYRNAQHAVRRGNLDIAAAELHKSLEADPDFNVSQSLLAQIHLHRGDVARARDALPQTDSLSFFNDLLVAGDVLLLEGKQDSARQVYESLRDRLDAMVDVPLLDFRLRAAIGQWSGNLFYHAQNPEPAGDLPDSIRVGIWAVRGLSFLALRDNENAIDAFVNAVAHSGPNDSAFLSAQLSVLYFWSGEYATARQHAEAARDWYSFQSRQPLADYYDYIAQLTLWSDLYAIDD